ncbi:MAG: dihydroorotase [Granulosicoccaceae bacterium]
MSRILLKGGRLIDPANGRDELADIAVHGELIAAADPTADYDLSLDMRGKVLCPGFVDLWARPGSPSIGHCGDIVSETTAAAYGGITTVCIPPDTSPTLDQAATVELIRGLARQAGTSRVRAFAALTHSLEGTQLSEIQTLMQVGCIGASQADMPIQDTRILRRAMEYAANFGIPLILQPCNSWLLADGCAHEGPVAQRLGLNGIPSAAETVAIAQIVELAANTGARVHFSRLSTARGAGLVRQAKADGLAISADASINHLMLADTALTGYNNHCKLMPPLRSVQDRDGLREALMDGTLDGICSDHRPVSVDGKAVPFDSASYGATGFDTFAALVLALGEKMQVSLSDCLGWVSYRPAQALSLPYGRLDIGAPADICVLDTEQRWTLEAEAMHSKGKNSPWLSLPLKGRCAGVVLRGQWLASPTR